MADLGAQDRKAALPHLAIKNWRLNGRDGSPPLERSCSGPLWPEEKCHGIIGI